MMMVSWPMDQGLQRVMVLVWVELAIFPLLVADICF
jgi:hypothetical protein